MKLSQAKVKEIIQRAIEHLLVWELRIRQFHCQIKFADNDCTEWMVDSRERFAYQMPKIVIEFGQTKTGNHGEAYSPSEKEHLVVVNEDLSLLQQIVVLAHELKHVQENMQCGETTEETAHHFDYTGLWYALQIGLINLRKYQQIQKLSRSGDLGPRLMTLI